MSHNQLEVEAAVKSCDFRGFYCGTWSGLRLRNAGTECVLWTKPQRAFITSWMYFGRSAEDRLVWMEFIGDTVVMATGSEVLLQTTNEWTECVKLLSPKSSCRLFILQSVEYSARVCVHSWPTNEEDKVSSCSKLYDFKAEHVSRQWGQSWKQATGDFITPTHTHTFPVSPGSDWPTFSASCDLVSSLFIISNRTQWMVEDASSRCLHSCITPVNYVTVHTSSHWRSDRGKLGDCVNTHILPPVWKSSTSMFM